MILISKHFPFINHYSIRKNYFLPYRNIVVLGIGANIKNCVKTFENLFVTLYNNSNLFLHSTSIIYKNKAFGYVDQPDFYNSSIVFLTNLCLREVFSYIFYLERKFGRRRIREFKNAQRTLDIDLIFFNNLKINYKHLTLPHKDYKNRMSVLLPLRAQVNFLFNREVA